MVASFPLSPPLDLPVGFLLAAFFVNGVIAFAGIAFLEALILILTDWPSMRIALLDSFLVNLATTQCH